MYLMPSISDGAGYEPTAMLSEDIKGWQEVKKRVEQSMACTLVAWRGLCGSEFYDGESSNISVKERHF
jgi:hypothetical protein